MKIFLKVILSLVVSSILAACSKNNTPPNVVLIVIDTMRADMLNRETAPFLHGLAEQGVLFRNAVSVSSWTAPATASILTGLYPLEHGILMGRRSTRKLFAKDPSTKLNKIPEKVDTIAELMKSGGYVTYAAVDNGNLREDSGFAQGFDYFVSTQNVGAEIVNSTLRQWATKLDTTKPYFLYVQYMDPHHPYIEHEPWFEGESKEGMERALLAYKSEVSYLDTKFKEMFHLYGWDKNTLILVTADHGEEFGEHGSAGHGKSLYGEVTRVPLFIYFGDRIEAQLVENHVSTVSVTPTLLGLAGISPKQRMSGVDLSALVKGDEQREFGQPYSHLWKKQKVGSVIEMKSLVHQSHKVIDSTKTAKTALFNLTLDPRERKNIARAQPDIVKDLQTRIDAHEKSFHQYEREWIDVPLEEEDFEE